MSDLRYIDVDIAQTALVDIYNSLESQTLRTVFYDSILSLKSQPIVDAVEVVRCKDCRHYPQMDCFGDACCNMFLRHSTVLVPRKPDDYCSYGKRRESEVSE